MWIVRLALRNPYGMAVLAALLFIFGMLSVLSMRVDIFPLIDIPVVGVVWQYTGLSPEEMESRVVFVAERGYTTTVNGISRVTSQSMPGIGLIQIYFQPGTDIGAAIAQITSSSMTSLRLMPPSMQPPVVVQFNASNVPVAQLTVSSETIPEEKLFDHAQNFIRMRLFTIPGLATPAPYGGKNRQISVDVDPAQLYARGLSPQDVVSTLSASNLIIPAGTARIGRFEYNVLLNSSPRTVEEFSDIPMKVVGGRPVTLGDVATIRDAYANQTNVVRINGKRATFLNILKKADASTLDVIDQLRDALPLIKANAPEGMKLRIDFDQSRFVRASIHGVLREALIAATLVALMILFFLGNWRSAFIVCTSIPLAIFTSIIALKLTGQSLNLMTLGGISLAIGMLVDDATVEIENIERNRGEAPSLTFAILKGASQVALPAIMATLSICVVFFPIGLLTGPAKFLFVPMAFAVVFAMLASYVLSRTLVPTLARLLLPEEARGHGSAGPAPRAPAPRRSAWSERVHRLNERRERLLERVTESYGRLLDRVEAAGAWLFIAFAGLVLISLALPVFVVGWDFFPTTDAGIIRMHFRAPTGTRIEETEKIVARVEDRIRTLIPARDLDTINSQLGIPISYNLAFVSTENAGPMDAEILVSLKEGHDPTADYQKRIRRTLESEFPGTQVSFLAADIVSQVLNFGLPAPIDVQIESKDYAQGYALADRLAAKMRTIPGAVDVHLRQVVDYPTLRVNVDRVRAAQLGLSQKDIASSMLISLSSSSLYAPSFFLNPENNVNYSVVAQAPLAKITSVEDLRNVPATPPSATQLLQPADPGGGAPAAAPESPQAPAQSLGNLASIATSSSIGQVSHQDIQRVVDVTAGVEGRDLAGVTRDIEAAIESLGKIPDNIRIHVLGQSETMRTSFTKLGLGLILAVALVYLLMVILFQSWLDPLIALIAVPGALTGVLWGLAVTGTSLNVVSLMGSIMAVGVAVSNSTLLVTFANDIRMREPGKSAQDAALEAGRIRLRPILMTALAMVLGMLPTALGLGEGASQNAPLGRAVIGGLLVATFTTLFVVPATYARLRRKLPRKQAIRDHVREENEHFEEEERKEYERHRSRHAGHPAAA